MTFLKRFADCDCPCHKSAAVVLHVVPCCDGYSPGRSKRKPARHDNKITAEQTEHAEKTL